MAYKVGNEVEVVIGLETETDLVSVIEVGFDTEMLRVVYISEMAERDIQNYVLILVYLTLLKQ